MYSLVLMAALTTGEGSANWHKHDLSCNYGHCYGGCYGVGYHGWGGWGQPYGGYGYGGPGVKAWDYPGYACWGGCGGYASPAYGVPMTPLVAPPPPPSVPDRDRTRDRDSDADKDKDKEKDKEKDKSKDKGKDKKEPDDETTAKIIFVLPEGATLHVDDRLVDRAAGTRTFNTPPLAKGKRYFYDVRVEVVRDGKPVGSTRRLVLQAGSVIRADFSTIGPAAGVAAIGR